MPSRRRTRRSGIRIAQAPGPGKSPHVEAEPGHGKGWYEVQDEGSQLATLLVGREAPPASHRSLRRRRAARPWGSRR